MRAAGHSSDVQGRGVGSHHGAHLTQQHIQFGDGGLAGQVEHPGGIDLVQSVLDLRGHFDVGGAAEQYEIYIGAFQNRLAQLDPVLRRPSLAGPLSGGRNRYHGPWVGERLIQQPPHAFADKRARIGSDGLKIARIAPYRAHQHHHVLDMMAPRIEVFVG